ncbi:MAG: hypothetical protein KZQ83_12240 [gamma proteobacterium symbiont of Taylorina sp.]|nr:hypothetical protein [gamma proteobacterium symbiont of Taylorina sp.]
MEKSLSPTEEQLKNNFMDKFQGRLVGILKWEQLDELWLQLQSDKMDDWFIYHIGEAVPVTICPAEQFQKFIVEINQLLRHDHQERYCGIIYVDNKDQPAFIKIYDPNNLGHVCGSSGAPPPLPGWILSKAQPVDIEAAIPPPGNRRKWWQKIFS